MGVPGRIREGGGGEEELKNRERTVQWRGEIITIYKRGFCSPSGRLVGKKETRFSFYSDSSELPSQDDGGHLHVPEEAGCTRRRGG